MYTPARRMSLSLACQHRGESWVYSTWGNILVGYLRESRGVWGGKVWRRQITEGLIPLSQKQWHCYGPRNQDTGPHPQFDPHPALEEFPSRALVWSHVQICLQIVSLNLDSLCVQHLSPRHNGIFSLNCSTLCILILILKSRPGIFSDSVFSDKTDCKSKGALFSLFGERKWKVLVLLLLLKLECTSTFFPYCNLFLYCSTFLPLPSCRCH